MKKPSVKFLVVFNLVQNIPMAVAMSITAPLLMNMPVFTPNLLMNILIGFILATIINLLLPIQKIAMGFPRLMHIKSDGFLAHLVGNIPVCLIFVVIVGLVLNLYNVRAVPDFLFAFLGTFIPMYLVLFVIAMIFVPIATKAAMAASREK